MASLGGTSPGLDYQNVGWELVGKNGALWVSEKGRGGVGGGNGMRTVLGRLVLEQWRVGRSEEELEMQRPKKARTVTLDFI